MPQPNGHGGQRPGPLTASEAHHVSSDAAFGQCRCNTKKRFGKGRALSIPAHRLGCAAYFMLRRGKAFDAQRFLATVN